MPAPAPACTLLTPSGTLSSQCWRPTVHLNPTQSAHTPSLATPPPAHSAVWVARSHKALCSTLGDERTAAMGLLAMGADALWGLLSDGEGSAEQARRLAEQQQLAEAMAAAAAEGVQQQQRREQRYRRRMVQAVQWIKGAARAPTGAANRPKVMQRALRAAKLIGSMLRSALLKHCTMYL